MAKKGVINALTYLNTWKISTILRLHFSRIIWMKA